MPASTASSSRPSVDLHLTVHGLVQGVGFREGMMRVAMQAQVHGWVCNRLNGTVEAALRGSEPACEILVVWARRGPPAGRVDRVDVRPATEQESALIGKGFYCLQTW